MNIEDLAKTIRALEFENKSNVVLINHYTQELFDFIDTLEYSEHYKDLSPGSRGIRIRFRGQLEIKIIIYNDTTKSPFIEIRERRFTVNEFEQFLERYYKLVVRDSKCITDLKNDLSEVISSIKGKQYE